jgi:hypothetical protein
MLHPSYAQDTLNTDLTNPHVVQDMSALEGSQSYRLRRPGARPLTFTGSEVAMAMSFTPELPYWYEINIYRTNNDHFFLAIRQFFQSETEADNCQAWKFENLAALFDAIESYDAAKDVKIGKLFSLPNAPAELTSVSLELRAEIAAIRANFASLVGELFEELDQSLLVRG